MLARKNDELIPTASQRAQAGERFAYIVDDDRDVRLSLGLLLKAFGIASRPFTEADDFLAELDHLKPGCVIIDVRMPGRDGVALLSEIVARGFRWPSIIITGHAEVQTAVRAMKMGAIEFLEKPFDQDDLLAALERGFADLADQAESGHAAREAELRIAKLTPRERAVLDGILAGCSNKHMALQMDLSPRTIELHRANLMRSLQVSSLTELLVTAAAAGLAIKPN
jgi:two-component system response regulator FixJ